MQSKRLIKNTFLLILGGFITKILGFIIKILYTRYLKEDGVALVSLTFPTYSLLLTISSFALPLAVTKLTSENKERKSKILFSSFWITFIINIILIIIFLLFSNYFAKNILHDIRCSPLIKILLFTLPFVCTTSLIKAYFFGIENIKPVILSNIGEELIKLIMVITVLPKIVNISIYYGTIFYIFIIFFCEIISFIILYLFLPKKINIKNLNYKYDGMCASKLMKISIPTLSGRLIGNIGYFFEPIILTNMLINKGYTSTYIIHNYGYFEGYVIQLLTLPSFFISALNNNLLPIISKLKINKKYNQIKKLTIKLLLLILILSISYMMILNIYGLKLMNILYKSSKGYKYLKMIIPFFFLFYLESPIYTILQALDEERKVFKITTSGIIIKYLSLIILIFLNKGFISLIISEIINIIYVLIISFYYLKKTYSYLLK